MRGSSALHFEDVGGHMVRAYDEPRPWSRPPRHTCRSALARRRRSRQAVLSGVDGRPSSGGGAMATRTARCACGRVEVTVEGEPLLVLICHCDFCQKRSGNVFIASAHFAEQQVAAISGETKVYNGLEVDGVGAVAVPGGI